MAQGSYLTVVVVLGMRGFSDVLWRRHVLPCPRDPRRLHEFVIAPVPGLVPGREVNAVLFAHFLKVEFAEVAEVACQVWFAILGRREVKGSRRAWLRTRRSTCKH